MNRTATSNGTGSVDLAVIAFGVNLRNDLKILRRFNSIDPIKETRRKINTTISDDLGGITPTFEAMYKAWQLFSETGRNDSFKAMFVVSDGLPGSVFETEGSQRKVKGIKPKLEADNITIYGLFLGGRMVGKEFMKNHIVSNESFFFHVADMTNASTMEKKLDLVVTGMCKEAAKQQGSQVYIINPDGESNEEKDKTTASTTSFPTTTEPDEVSTTDKSFDPKATGLPTWAIAVIGCGSGLLIVVVATSSVLLYKRCSEKGFSARGEVKDAGFDVDIMSFRSVKEPVSNSKTAKQRASRSSAKALLTKAIRET